MCHYKKFQNCENFLLTIQESLESVITDHFEILYLQRKVCVLAYKIRLELC